MIPALIRAAGMWVGKQVGSRAATVASKRAATTSARNALAAAKTPTARKAARHALHEAQHPSPPRDRAAVLDALWKIDSAFSLFERIAGKLKDWTSTFVHTIQVAAIGGPNADLRRTWFLACSAAFGRYRNRVGATGMLEFQLEATWDITGKAVMISLGYTMQGVVHQAQDALTPEEGSFAGRLFGGQSLRLAWGSLEGGGARTPATSAASRTVTGGIDGARELIMRGPDQVTVGGGWPFFVRGAAGSRRTGQIQYSGDSVQKALLAQFGDYNVRRFGGPGGPRDPNVLRERPWSLNLSTGAAGVALPFGQTADLGTLPDFFRLYGPAKQPFTLTGTTVIDGETVSLLPILPDAGRVITTGEKYHPDVQNPRPAGDGISRLSPLQLVTLALESPCNAPARVAPADTPVGHKGVRLQDATTASLDPLNRPIFTAPIESTAATVAATAVASALFPGFGPIPASPPDNAVPPITEDA